MPRSLSNLIQHVYTRNGRAAVCGIPDDDHDCDAMGCSSMEHVIARVPHTVDDHPAEQPKAAQVGKVHDLKTWPEYFIAMLEGRKTFELRRDDRGFTVGDTLLLREFEPSTCEYTGRELRREITHILRGPMFGLNVGHAILSLRQSRDAGRWIPWDVDADAITPESGWHLTTVRGCRGDDLRITGVANFAKDNVIAYWSIPLPPPYASQGDDR